jgi:glutathione S-transferase
VNELEADALTVLMHRLAMPPEQRKLDLAEAAEKRLKVPLRVLEQHLQRQAERGRDHLAAERFTVADLCVASVMGWVKPARALLEAHPPPTPGWRAGPSRAAGHARLGTQQH